MSKKYKLKEGVKATDIPRYSSLTKQISNVLSTVEVVECDNMPEILLKLVEEVVETPKKEKSKGGK